MRIDNSFTLALPVEDAWNVLLDVERIAPCMPGAELKDATDDEYRGIIKVKLGAITAEYEGAARFSEVDEATHYVVLKAEGRETGGQGNASATVTATLQPAGEGRTQVAIETDLTISGRIAQFGRGVIADVSSKLVGEFAKCLEKDLSSASRQPPLAATPVEVVADEIADVAVDDPERAAQLVSAVTNGSTTTMSTTATTATTRTIESKPAGPVDVPAVAGGSVADRAVPAAIVGILVLQILPKGRLKRLGLAVLGSALVAGMVAGKRRQ